MQDLQKKGQELPMNVIIIAALALIVLIVILFMFSGNMRVFNKHSSSCEDREGVCTASACPEGYSESGFSCGPGDRCCLRVMGSEPKEIQWVGK